jgi:predicted transcriptional regulator
VNPTPPQPVRVGDLQLRILQVLWAKPEATVAEVNAALKPERDLAYTTVATMLRKMEARGLVSHREDGRSFLYRARVNAEQIGQGMADHMVEKLFDGSLAGTVSHLLRTREVSREELEELERLIRAAKRRTK